MKQSRLQAAVQSTWFSLGLAHPGGWNYSSFSRASLWSSRNWFADYCQHRGNSNGAKLTGSTAFPVTILGGLGGQRFTRVRSYLIGLTFGVLLPVVHPSWQRCWLGLPQRKT